MKKWTHFFDSRLDGYDEHQLTCIASAEELYPFTARYLPVNPGTQVLDLGCGTGLELEYYFQENPTAKITGIDLAPGMLEALRSKFPTRDITLILGSYFAIPFGSRSFYA